MKKILFAIALFPLLLNAQAVVNPYEQMFWQQMSASCSGEIIWEKSVEETGEDATYNKESHTYSINCGAGTIVRTDAEDNISPGLSEFDFLFEYDCQNPYIKDLYNVEETNGSIAATLLPSEKGETPLVAQTFALDQTTGKLIYAKSHIVKHTRLYEMEVHIQVWFDAKGRYLRHETETMTAPILKSPVRTLIKAEVKS